MKSSWPEWSVRGPVGPEFRVCEGGRESRKLDIFEVIFGQHWVNSVLLKQYTIYSAIIGSLPEPTLPNRTKSFDV